MTPRQQAVLNVLQAHDGRVVGRRQLAREAGLSDLNTRRCDSLIADIRRDLGPHSVRTVRRRGWMLGSA